MPRLVALACLLATPALADPAPLEKCGPIDRRHEHVELRTPELGRLRRTPTGQIGLVAMRDGRTQPIPFQIDESRGRKPILVGPGARIDQHPGVLDHDDVLVFLPCDAGTRAPDAERARWSETFGARHWREIRVRDPLDGQAAYVYVIVAAEPPRTTHRYVGYADTDLVATATYRIGMAGALPAFFSMHVDGRTTPNLLDGLRLRADGEVRGGLSSVSLTERDARHRLTAWGDGAIRVVRRSEHHVNIGLGIHVGVGTAHTYFYPLRISGPGKLSLPFSPGLLFREITAAGGVDLTGLGGWTFQAAGLTTPFEVDGRTVAAEASATRPGHWFVLARGRHALITVFRMSPNFRDAIPLNVWYVDDGQTPRPPERERGSVPLVGFRAGGLESLDAEKYEWVFEVLFEPDYEPGREQTLLAQLDSPVTASLTARGDHEGDRVAHR